jgi:flagellar motor switch protein FliN/FliY
MSLSRQEWFDRIVTQLAIVIGALVERAAAAGPGTEAPQRGWVATLRASGSAHGSLSIEFDEAATEALTTRIMAFDARPPEPMVVDTLKEICGQAAGALVQEPPLVGTKLVLESVQRASVESEREPALMQVAVAGGETLRLRLWGDIALNAMPSLTTPDRAPATPAGPKLDVILDIDLPLVVRFGRTEMPVRTLAALGPGSVIDLGRAPDESVEVLVGSQVVAHGEVVIVGGNYGVRITDVIGADRVRSMEVDF